MNHEGKILGMLETIQSQLKEQGQLLKEQEQQLKEQGQQIKEQGQLLKEQGQQIKEHGQILKALEHNAEINKAEHDRIFHELANIHGELKEIRKDLSNVELITASNWSDIAKLKKAK